MRRRHWDRLKKKTYLSGMDSPQDIKTLLRYLNGELPAGQEAELERFILDHPEYQKVLKGLNILTKHYSSSRELLDFLQERKAGLKKGLFRK